MFSQASVILSTGVGCMAPQADIPLGRYPWADIPPADTIPGRHPLGRHPPGTPPGRHPPGRHTPQADTPPRYTTPGQTPPAQCMLGWTPLPHLVHSGILAPSGHCSERYTSYCNAFLFLDYSSPFSLISKHFVCKSFHLSLHLVTLSLNG